MSKLLKGTEAAHLKNLEERPHSVQSHFSFFVEPSKTAEWAETLPTTEDIQGLADRFLGSQVAGVPVRRNPQRGTILVAERYVAEARLLCERHSDI